MRRYIKSVISNPVFSGSAVMIIGSNATNFINYLYQIAMGKLLVPAYYGELAAIISLIGLISVVPFSLGLVIVKFVSSAKSEKDVEALIGFMSKKVFLISLGMFFLVVLFSFQLAAFLNIKNPLLLVLAATTFLFTLPALLYRSILQGLVKFNQMVISILGESLSKLILAVLAILIGLSLPGVILALIISSLTGLLLVRFFTRNLRTKSSSNKFIIGPLIYYSIPILILSAATTSLYSADLIIVKHFFSAFDSGLYAALSTLSKIIFFGTGPISTVMFPMIARKHTVGESYHKVFLNSLGLTLLLSFAVLSVYWLFPDLVIKVSYGQAYLKASRLLFWFGLATTSFTVASLFLSFYLSLGKTKVVILPAVAAICQIAIIWVYHPNLIAVIFALIVINTLLLVSLVLYSLPFKIYAQAKRLFFPKR